MNKDKNKTEDVETKINYLEGIISTYEELDDSKKISEYNKICEEIVKCNELIESQKILVQDTISSCEEKIRNNTSDTENSESSVDTDIDSDTLEQMMLNERKINPEDKSKDKDKDEVKVTLSEGA